MRNVPVLILSGADTGSVTGSAIFAGQFVSGSFIPLTGDASASGTVKLQGSNEPPVGSPEAYTPSSGSWSDIPNATSTIASGVGPLFTIQTLCYQYIRAIYTRSGGGSTTVKVYASFLAI